MDMKQRCHVGSLATATAATPCMSLCVTILYSFVCMFFFLSVDVASSFSMRPTSPTGYHHHQQYHFYVSTAGTGTAPPSPTATASTNTKTTFGWKSKRHAIGPGMRRSMLDDPNQLMITTTASVWNTVTTAALDSTRDVSPDSTTTPSIHQLNLVLQHFLATYLHYLNHYSLFTQSVTAAFFAGMGDVLAQFISSSIPKQQPLQQQQQHLARMNQPPLVLPFRTEDDADSDINSSSSSNDVVMEEERATTATSEEIATGTKPFSYDVQRTMHYVFKGLGGGCMWSVWFSYSDPISLDLTQRFLELYLVPNYNTEVGFAIINGDIDVATATSHVLSTYVPVLSVSGCTLQHIIHVAICIVLEQFFVSPFFYTVWDIPIPALLSGSPIRQIPAQIQAKLVPLLIANAKVWTPANIVTYSLPSEYRVLFASMTDVIWQTILSDITSNEIILQPPPIPKAPLRSSVERDSVSVVTTVEQGSSSTSSSSTTATPNAISDVSDAIRVTTTAATVTLIAHQPLPVSSVGNAATAPTMTAAATIFQSNAARTNGID